MCGITGIFHLNGQPASPMQLRRMTDSIAHRGPDGEGFYTDHFIGLGHAFHRYEISLTTIEFSKDKGATLPMIKCRTKDGLELDLEISLQYKVEKDNIY